MAKNIQTNDYELIRTLEMGSNTEIKLIKEKQSKELYVLKQFNYCKRSKYPKNEYNTLKKLNHKNIIKAYNFYEDKNKSCLVLEYAKNGDFFGLVQKNGGFSENLAKFYSRQLLEAIFYLKQKNISHRDLKLENLLLCENLDLKLADFEYSKIIDGKKKNLTHIGTKAYMSPELHYKKKYDSEKVDAFSFGITLFVMVAAHPPFHVATHNDKYYVMFNRQRNKFWEIHEKISGKSFSENFKILVGMLFEYNPVKRFGFDDVKESDFFKESECEDFAKNEIRMFL